MVLGCFIKKKKKLWILISLSKHSLALFVILKFKLNVYLTNDVRKKKDFKTYLVTLKLFNKNKKI